MDNLLAYEYIVYAIMTWDEACLEWRDESRKSHLNFVSYHLCDDFISDVTEAYRAKLSDAGGVLNFWNIAFGIRNRVMLYYPS